MTVLVVWLCIAGLPSNIEFIEVPQVVGGEALVPANEAIFVADDGDSSFITYHGPANCMGYVTLLLLTHTVAI